MYRDVRICPESAVARDEELTEAESEAVAFAIREHLARRRMSRQRLADDAKISISTLEKALGGSRPFTLATLVRLETALGVKLRREDRPVSAPAALGAYSRASVTWLEGDYLTLRPSFEVKDAIYAYRTAIRWDEGPGCLGFAEAERLDAPYAQKGVISLPNKSGHVYLHTNDEGQMRLAILSHPLITGQMYGVMSTLLSAGGGHLVPVAVPFALVPLAPDLAFGRIVPGDSLHQRYRDHLCRAMSEDFLRFIPA
jgi:transcriptional regulator with XRE-family HTH domain